MTSRAIDIPFDRDGSGRFLPWLIGLMVYLAALALSGALALDGALENWDRGLAGSLTVELPPAQDKTETDLAAALAALRASPGVSAARPMARAEVAALLEPWLGADLPQELALPRLVDVSIANDIDLAGLRPRLAAAAPGAVLDDHRIWLDRLAVLVRTAEATAIGIVLLIGAAAVLSVVFTTRTGLAVHRDVIELLHLMGARDRYIAAQFERQAVLLGLAGGAIGLALALATLFALARAGAATAVLGEGAAALPSVGLAPWQYTALFALPVAAALLALATARFTVLRALARMP
ncbi:MAG TPA: FtsX-like permease family protein [Stellaceae bacterium]|nr:FtsX-like permease family protein [Stellaceae bacterium]